MAGLPVNKSTSLSLITDAKSAKRMICFFPRYVRKIITIISPTEYIHRRVWDYKWDSIRQRWEEGKKSREDRDLGKLSSIDSKAMRKENRNIRKSNGGGVVGWEQSIKQPEATHVLFFSSFSFSVFFSFFLLLFFFWAINFSSV